MLGEASNPELHDRLGNIEETIILLLKAMGVDPNNLPDPNDPNMPHFILKKIEGLKPRRQVKKKHKLKN